MRQPTPSYMQLVEVADDDHEWLVELHNDPEVLRNLTHPQPITLAQHFAWWATVRGDVRQARRVFTVNGVRVGFTKFYDIDRENGCCALGADIHREHRGMGYAKHMWELMLHRCFVGLCLHRVSLTTAEFNLIGQRVYRGLGFREEGRLIQSLCRDGRFYDQVCMYMLRSDWEDGTIGHG